jgi:uncharacterized damage-inducible protein DinB
MALSDPIQILLAQNHWATRNLLDSCAHLTQEQFHRRFEMGLGSLHDTVIHILGAMRGWGDMLAGRAQRPRLEYDQRTVPELLMMLDEISADLVESAAAHPNEDTVTGERAGKSYTFTRGAVLTHVLTHGMHHRAQALNMLRQLGVEKVPPSSVVEWVLMVDQTP